MWTGRTLLKAVKKGCIDPDALLMLQYKAGDEKSFEILFNKYFKYVLNLSRRFFDQEAQAEEMAQEVFTQIYLARESYEATAQFKTWLYRITLNKCLNEKRKGIYQSPSYSIDEVLEDDEGGIFNRELKDRAQPTPLENYEKTELEKIFKKALDCLTEQQRVCFILSRFGDLSYAEIAETTQTSENAVKSLIHRANVSLKDYLQDYFNE
ncbi:MAG: RNA polymerase sigma factor [Nitrospiria bacterium]